MSFLIDASDEDMQSGAAYKAYRDYLGSIKERLPETVYDFAIADWHYDFRNPKCPHDAWVQEIKIRELAEGNRRQIRHSQIEITLLGAYHDRLLKLTYENVSSYAMNSGQSRNGHGDWLIDEISLSDAGLVVHKMKFANDVLLHIESNDIIFDEEITK